MAIIFFTLLFFTILLLVVKMIVYPWWNEPYYDPYAVDHNVTTYTTTTTTTTVPLQDEQPQWDIVGNLQRKKARNGQFYVIDPVDNKQMFLNDTDDLYEDGAGKIWKLV